MREESRETVVCVKSLNLNERDHKTEEKTIKREKEKERQEVEELRDGVVYLNTVIMNKRNEVRRNREKKRLSKECKQNRDIRSDKKREDLERRLSTFKESMNKKK